MKTIKVQTEDTVNEVEIAEYKKGLLKSFKVKDFEHPEHGATPAKNIVDHVVDSLMKDKEVDETIAQEFSDLYKQAQTDISYTKANTQSKAEKAAEDKAKKEEEKAAAEAKKKEEEAKVAVRQDTLVGGVAAGADLAAGEFKDELESLAKNLPEGVTVEQKGAGYGLTFGEGASEETIGATLGYLNQKAAQSAFVGNQLHFWIGDTISRAVELKIFTTAKEASEKISKLLEEKHGKKIVSIQLDEYKRMAERTPLALRNPKVDISAYNAVAKIKTPTKGEKESDASYKERVAKFEKGREALQEKLASGDITSRKDITPLVNEFQYEQGIKERPDPNAVVVSLSDNYQIVAHTTFALDNLVGTHEDHPEAAVYKHGENLIPVSKAELEEKRDEALANIFNILYTSKKAGLNPKDYARGFVEKETEVAVGKDGDGKTIKEKQKSKVPVYPAPFWTIAE